tara:strand:- start:994 stop:1302 length:309 start_codon:yes stop_codon:yes gene_type:complete
MDLIALDTWHGWVLLGTLALTLEFLAPTFIFLSLAIALGVMGGLTEMFSLTLPAQLVVVSALWVGLSLLLRKVFGNWGQTAAAEDPNQYERKTSEPEAKTDD